MAERVITRQSALQQAAALLVGLEDNDKVASTPIQVIDSIIATAQAWATIGNALEIGQSIVVSKDGGK